MDLGGQLFPCFAWGGAMGGLGTRGGGSLREQGLKALWYVWALGEAEGLIDAASCFGGSFVRHKVFNDTDFPCIAGGL